MIDLGAHLGEFSQGVHRSYGCRCLAVEANPELFKRMASGEGIEKLNCAIAGADGQVSFTIDPNPEASHLAQDSRPGSNAVIVSGCTLETIKQRAGITSIDLLKLDIEGAEFEVLASLSDSALQAIPQITVEFHDFIDELRCSARVAETKCRLIALGFACVVFSRVHNSDVLFVNRRYWRASPLQWFYLKHVARYFQGAQRILQRRFT